MRLIETSKTSIVALNANKIRATLTMLGVIIGVFSVVTLVSIGTGLQNYITDQFNSLGSNLLFVIPGSGATTGDPSLSFGRNKLTMKDIELIESNVDSTKFDTVTPTVELGDSVEYKTKKYYARVIGTDYKAGEVFNYTVDKGQYFTKSQQDSNQRVAFIGPTLAEELFGSRDPIGGTIRLGDDSYTVIGTFKPKGRNFDDSVIVPYQPMMDTFGIKNISSIVVKVNNPENVDTVSREIKLALLKNLKPDDFSVMSQTEILSSITNVLSMLTMGIGAIAGISLLVGGIGIMNIMLVSVTERTKEIGLRKAVGATPLDIATQFLIESIFLSIGGGAIGLALGYAGAAVSQQFLRTEIPLWAVFLAFGFSVLVGVAFGTYPAIQAAKKDPIEALRYE